MDVTIHNQTGVFKGTRYRKLMYNLNLVEIRQNVKGNWNIAM